MVHEAAAALFVDALGRDLPFRASFSYKEMHDFLRREGVLGLEDLHGKDLVLIAEEINSLTGGQVTVSSEPTPAPTRTPLSRIDLNASTSEPATAPAKPVKITDRVYLSRGPNGHVVAIRQGHLIAMTDDYQVFECEPADVMQVVSLDDPI